jgi:tetratricopeptide (TPR) repeat protein
MNEQGPDIAAGMNEALALHAKGALDEAEKLYRAILKRQRNHADAQHMMGVLNFQRGDAPMAMRYFQRAVAARPDFPDALNNLAGLHLHLGKPKEALAVVQRALSAHGEFIPGLLTCARAQHHLGDSAAAIATFERLDALNPEDKGYEYNWAESLMTLGRYAEAESRYAAFLRFDPDNLDARCLHAQSLKAQGRFTEALAELDEILSANPDFIPALVQSGDALQALGDTTAAIERFRKAISIQPDHAEAHFNLGVSLLTFGAFHEGWREYAWRFRMDAYAGFMPPASAPLWTGEPLEGKSILMFAEQGLGDTLQFARYATMLSDRGAVVSCQCSASVADIIATIDGVADIYTFEHVPPIVDYQISMMELPRLFDTTADTVPAQVGYLRSPKDTFRVAKRPSIGIVWQGNPAHKNDAYRSLPLARFEAVLGMKAGSFYSLQVGDGVRQIAALGWQDRIEDMSSHLVTFADTADIMSKLDLVISVDTSVAHLAGGLGVPVWVLLPTIADWRWGREGEETCWYRSMRLFRQQRLGEWDTVFAELEQALAGFFADRS